jgi:phospholipase C
MKEWTRRETLRAAGVLAGAGGMAAAMAGTARASGPPRRPGSRPFPHLPEGHDSIPRIEHVVVLMMENHSYDNYLGTLGRPGADGFTLGGDGLPTATNPTPDGGLQRAFRMPTHCQPGGQAMGHVTQEWEASHRQYDNGRLDGFVRTAGGSMPMGYWTGDDLPFYHSLAGVFPLADRYFCSVLGQTEPNRRFLMAGTSVGQVDDVVPELALPPPHGTIFDRLNAHRISWYNYFSNQPSTFLFPETALANLAHMRPIRSFFTDAAAGRLPFLSLVDPDFDTQSEENPQDVARGEAFAAQVVNAVMHGKAWERTLLIWTYDEHGGYYDHLPPPAAFRPDGIGPLLARGQHPYDRFGRYGFRVPCVVVSPWARRKHVSHTVYDHTSILALVETKWNLPAMTYRDANASNLLDMLDLRRPHFARPPTLAAPILTTDPSVTSCEPHR